MNPEITDNIVELLLSDSSNAEEFSITEVSDSMFYGRKNCRKLSGRLEDLAEQSGFKPIVYQAVLWRCIVYVPFFPVATYIVVPRRFDPNDSVTRFRGTKAPFDVMQVSLQYLVVLVSTFILGIVLFFLLR